MKEYGLAPDDRLVFAMYIHPDVDIVHEVASAGDLKLLAGLIAVHTPYNDLTFTERFGLLLPLAGEAADAGLPLQPKDRHLREVEFRRLGETVGKGRADESVQIGFFDYVVNPSS